MPPQLGFGRPSLEYIEFILEFGFANRGINSINTELNFIGLDFHFLRPNYKFINPCFKLI
ncbi:hypothetical protein LQW54_001964 [Pestalotiopsis sp. IQ-011]